MTGHVCRHEGGGPILARRNSTNDFGRVGNMLFSLWMDAQLSQVSSKLEMEGLWSRYNLNLFLFQEEEILQAINFNNPAKAKEKKLI